MLVMMVLKTVMRAHEWKGRRCEIKSGSSLHFHSSSTSSLTSYTSLSLLFFSWESLFFSFSIARKAERLQIIFKIQVSRTSFILKPFSGNSSSLSLIWLSFPPLLLRRNTTTDRKERKIKILVLVLDFNSISFCIPTCFLFCDRETSVVFFSVNFLLFVYIMIL